MSGAEMKIQLEIELKVMKITVFHKGMLCNILQPIIAYHFCIV